jgi:hypothetical protein
MRRKRKKWQNAPGLFFVNVGSNSFFLQPSCSLGCINRYGWVVLVEKVSRPWRGQSDDFGHGGELIFRARASPCNMLRNMLRNMLHGTA